MKFITGYTVKFSIPEYRGLIGFIRRVFRWATNWIFGREQPMYWNSSSVQIMKDGVTIFTGAAEVKPNSNGMTLLFERPLLIGDDEEVALTVTNTGPMTMEARLIMQHLSLGAKT